MSPSELAPQEAPARSDAQGHPASEAADKLIVALDFSNAVQALALVDRLEGRCRWFKVGLELYLAAGNAVVSALKGRGFSVFLDLKLHDIPNTVAGAVRSVAGFGADMLTLHACGGPAMLVAAADAAAGLSHAPRLLAVTVLTSMDAAQLTATGISDPPAEQALRLAKVAHASGIHGLVCSPEEASLMRRELTDSILVTPGIRPAGSAIGDQKRIATPSAALAAGADYLVVGRPITQAEDSLLAARAILNEIATGN
ncbi:orotidine-5'-phosphate decarboxylase [Alloacidobacterium dinghuense]|uniref:Orotidine 5'-phosphate decarboxylase n=1 Tax=Alloacidobacterium dinghuense TaxID=2763107 RepID=A0A7G8BNC9_9BACT|nr:orotidine-5'-phosphate decarboxylase [Alloacidobacterium dinghuense]QNI34049.1 orotidine-5'-phosphate decarboxylase [Alloacidobacterium dinghuense]